MDEGAFVLDYWSPGGTSLAETDRQLHIIERILAETPEITGTSRRLGAELGPVRDAAEPRRHRRAAEARIASATRDIFEVIDDVRDKVAAAVPRFRVEFVADPLRRDRRRSRAAPGRSRSSCSAPTSTRSRRTRSALAPKRRQGRRRSRTSSTASREPSGRDGNEDQAAPRPAALGLTPQQVSAEVSGALLGVSAGEVRLDDRSIGVRVRAPDSVRFNAQRARRASRVLAADAAARRRSAALADFTPGRDARRAAPREPAADDRD